MMQIEAVMKILNPEVNISKLHPVLLTLAKDPAVVRTSKDFKIRSMVTAVHSTPIPKERLVTPFPHQPLSRCNTRRP
jgi:hypothetical protein